MDSPLTASDLANQAKHPLFAGKTWLGSPKSWLLDSDQVGRLDRLGEAALSFYRAIDSLYRKAWSEQSILRNRSLSAPWVADYFDAGKPDWLVKHARSDAVQTIYPAVLRPDLLPTAEGLSLTEWDAVPGGIGLTAHLEASFGFPQEGRMIDSFGEALADAARALGGRQAAMVIVVSEESATYRPEMEWLADELRKRSFSIRVCSPEDLAVRGEQLLFGEERIQLVYRFWELFDYDNLPLMKELIPLVESGNLVVTPPMKHTQEEKLSLALFHHHRLQAFWEEVLEERELLLLREMIPPTWVLDPAEIPPGAYLDGPTVQGRALSNWMELGQASKRERKLVLKASGFHETAWGARSVRVGDDLSADDWSASLQSALDDFPSPVSVVQEFRKPKLWEHPVFSPKKEVTSMRGRLRLSPYYFVVGGKAKRVGALATFCPADKKIIHGMKDGALIPCDP